MKLQITGAALTAAASWTAPIAGINPHRPIAAGVLLATDEIGLTLAATDYDTFGTAMTDATVVNDGHVVVSARLLAAVAKTLRATDDVTLECADHDTGLTVRCGRSRWVLPCMDSGDWPTFPTLGDPVGRIRADVFTRALKRVLPEVSADEATPTMTGVAFDITQDALTLVATDRRQIAAAELAWQPTVDSTDVALIVPADLLKATMAVIGGTDEIELRTDGATVGFACAGHRIIGRLIAGTFPAWRTVMAYPANNPAATVAVNLAELRHAVVQVSAVASRGAKVPDLIRLVFVDNGVEVSLASESQHATDALAYADALTQTGEPPTVGVSHDCLSSALIALDSETVVFTFPPEHKHGFLLQPADETGTVAVGGYTHMIAPRQLPPRASV